MDQLINKLLYYWAFTGCKIGVGVFLMFIGVLIIQLKEDQNVLGILLLAVGLGSVFLGIGTMDTKTGKEKPPPPPPPQTVPGFGSGDKIHIEMKGSSGS